jgi:1,4-alpha-glucan branching enzyme
MTTKNTIKPKTTYKQKTAASSKPLAEKKPQKKSGASSGIRKKYFKSKPVCSVTFMLPGLAAPGASLVCIVGDFNNWSINSHPMKRLKSGDFTICLELEPGRHYQYRYLIDDFRWENDWNADAYITTPYGDSENSVVIV